MSGDELVTMQEREKVGNRMKSVSRKEERTEKNGITKLLAETKSKLCYHGVMTGLTLMLFKVTGSLTIGQAVRSKRDAEKYQNRLSRDLKEANIHHAIVIVDCWQFMGM